MEQITEAKWGERRREIEQGGSGGNYSTLWKAFGRTQKLQIRLKNLQGWGQQEKQLLGFASFDALSRKKIQILHG